MAYTPLSKLYYSDNAKYKETLAARLSHTEKVSLKFDISGNPAFFLQLPELYKTALEVERIDKRVRELMAALPGKAIEQFTQRCLIDEIILTNSLEGVHSTRREVSLILSELENHDTRRRFRGLTAKYAMLTRPDEIPLENCGEIRDIYNELVLSEVTDEDISNVPDGLLFRKESVSVYSETQKEIHRGLYPERSICESMENALAILRDDSIEPLFRISAFHYFFGYIHPFYDGNGRTARFICSYLIAKELEPLLGYRISYTIKEHRRDYYEAFKVCNDPRNHGDITPFLLHFMEVIKVSIMSLESALKKRHTRLNAYSQKVKSLPLGEDKKHEALYFLLIQAALFAEDGISTADLTSTLEIARTTLDSRLKQIESGGFLVRKKVGRANYYSLNLSALDG